MSKTQVGIQLVLEGSAQAEAGLKRFSGSLSQMDSAVSAARQSLVSLAPALGAAFAAAALAQMVKGVQDAASEVERLSRLAGSTPQEFQRFAAGAKSVNVDLEKFASIMKDTQDKLGDFMQTGGGELKDFFEKIGPKVGVTAESFKNLSGPQALQLFYNSLQKANLSQKETVFWMESIADDATLLAPLLANNGAEFERLADKAQAAGVVMSDYLLAASKDLSQQTGALDDQLKAAGNTIAEQLFPALTEAARALVDFNRDGELASMAAAGIRTAFETVVIVGANVAYVIKQTGVELDGLAAQAAAVAKLDFKGAGRIGEMMREDAAAARAELDAFERRLLDAGKNSKAFFDVTQDLKAAKFGSDAYIQSVEKLVAMQASGKITVEQLNATLRAVQPAAQAAGKGLSGMGVGAEDAKKAAEAAKKAAESLKKSYQDAMGAGAQQARDLAAETDKLNAAEKKLADLMAGDAWPKWTEAQRAAVQALYERNSQTIKAQELAKAEAKWMEQSATENQKFADSAYEAADALEQQLKEQLQANEAIGLTGTALAELEASRLRDAAAEKTRLAAIMEGIDPGIAEIYRRQAAVLDKLAAAKLAGGIKQAAAEASKAAQEEWRDASREIERSLTDALLRGFESGKDFGRNLVDTLKNLFKSLVLRPVIQAIVQPVAGAVLGSLGLPGAAQAGTSASAGALNAAGTLNSAYNLMSNGVSASITAGFTKLAQTSLGSQLGLSNGVTASAVGPVQPGLSELGASVSSAASVVAQAAIATAVSRMLSGGYKIGNGKIMDAATMVASYFDPTGGLASGAISGVINRAFGKKLQEQGIEGQFGGEAGFTGSNYQYYKGGWFSSSKTTRSALDEEVRGALADQYRALQLQTGLMATTLGLGTDAIAGFTASVKLNFKGLTKEQSQARLAEEFAKVGESMARLALGTDEYSRTGETAVQTMTRLSGVLTGVNGVFDTLGQTLYGASLQNANLAQLLADTFGGLDKLQQAASSYYQNFYTDAERTATTTRQLGEALAALGLSMPESRDAFRDLVEAQDLSTESGRRTYAALLGLSGTFAAIVPAVDELALANERAAQAAETFAASMESARSAAQAVADAEQAVTQALYQQQLAAAQALQASYDDAFELARQAAADLQASYDEAYQSARQAADAANAAARAMGELHDSLMAFVRGESQAPSDLFANALSKALAGDSDAMRALPQLANASLEAARATARNATDLARVRAQTLIGVQDAAAVAAARSTLTMADPVRRMAELAERQLVTMPTPPATEDPVAAATRELAEAVEMMGNSIQAAIKTDLINKLGEIDTNLSGAVDWSEFSSKFSGMASENTLKTIFTALDSDRSGVITRLEAIVKNTGQTALNIGTSTANAVTQSPTATGTDLSAFTTLLKNEAVKNGLLESDISSSFATGLFSQLDRDNNLRLSTSEASASTITNAVKQILDAKKGTTGGTSGSTGSTGGTTGGTGTAAQSTYTAKDLEIMSRHTIVNDPPGNTGYENYVYKLYTQLINRKPELNGFNYWVNLAKSYTATHGETVANQKIQQEFKAVAGSNYDTKAKAEQFMEDYFIGLGMSAWGADKYAAQYTAFAKGGIFTDSVVNQPTTFPMGLMGEAGPEAIMPLRRGPNGSLGVMSYGSSEAIVSELRELRTQNAELARELSMLRAESRATAVNTGRTTDLIKRVTRNGEAMQTEAAA